MDGSMLAFGPSTEIKNDCFLDELLSPYIHDSLVEYILPVILSALAKTCRH